MKAIKAAGNINEQGQIFLDRPLITDKNRRVEVIVLILEESERDGQDRAIELASNSLQEFVHRYDQKSSGEFFAILSILKGRSPLDYHHNRRLSRSVTNRVSPVESHQSSLTSRSLGGIAT